jgi:hypothetical protein
MKELNENQLRGWLPRRPSRALKSRIFSGPNPAATEADDEVPWKWSFSAPAMVCLLFAMLMIHFNNGDMHEPKPAWAMVSSNGDRAASFSDSAQENENHLSAITFDWTNHTGFQSSIGFTPTTNLSN